MSTTTTTPLCSVCRKKAAIRKLSILVCEDHYAIGRPAMYDLLYKLRLQYQLETPVVIEPQPTPPPPTTTPPVVKPVDQFIHEAVNRARTNAGLRTLSYDEALEAVAYKHSRDMVLNDYFSHTGRNGSSVSDRYRASGYTGCIRCGENIAWFSTSRLSGMSNQDIGDRIFGQWWNSSGHKANILRPEFRIEGIGIYISGQKVMATQNFCTK